MVEARWFKGFLVKKTFEYAASILRWAGDIAEYWIKKAGLDWEEVIQLLNNRHKVAEVLDNIADSFDILSYNIRDLAYRQFLAAGIPHNIAWIAADFVEFLAF